MSLISQEAFDKFPQEAKDVIRKRYAEYRLQLHTTSDNDMKLATAAVMADYIILFGIHNIETNTYGTEVQKKTGDN